MLIALVIAAAAVSANLAVVLTAVEARRQPAETSLRMGLLLRLVRRPLWRLAAVLDLGGWVLKTVALLIAPLTVVAPGMALGLFLLLVFAAVGLREPIRASSLLGVGMLAGGVALVAMHSPEREVSVAGPLPWTITAALLLGGALLAFVARAWGLAVAPSVMALSCGFAWALNGLLSKLMADSISSGRHGLLATAAAGALGVGALGYLAKTSALQAGTAASVESIIGVVNTLVPVALAPVLFAEEWPSDMAAAAQLTVGLALVGIGVWLVTRTTAAALARRSRRREAAPSTSTSG